MIILRNDGFHMTVTTSYAADNLEILCCGKLKEIVKLLLNSVFYFRPQTLSFTGL